MYLKQPAAGRKEALTADRGRGVLLERVLALAVEHWHPEPAWFSQDRNAYSPEEACAKSCHLLCVNDARKQDGKLC